MSTSRRIHNSNMTVDKNSGITRVSYDANNQPDSVTFSTGESIRYYYDGMGNRLGTDEYTAFMPVYLQGAANTLTNDEDREVLRRRYCGNFVYEDGILQRVLVEGGFITFSNGTPQYHFYIKDHLGSNRVVTDANGNIEEYNHYFPYGALFQRKVCAVSEKYLSLHRNVKTISLCHSRNPRHAM